MEGGDTITIILGDNDKRSTRKVNNISPKTNSNKQYIELQGYSEIQPEYIRHLHGSWIKFSDKKNGKIYSGGFLQKIYDKKIFLRCPAQGKENLEVPLDGYIFYTKNSGENYMSLQDLLKEHEKALYNINENFSKKHSDLIGFKTKMIKMLNDGKISRN